MDCGIVWQIGVPKSMFTYHIEGQFHFGFILFLNVVLREQHSEIYLLTLKEQDKTKMELPLDMVSISASICQTSSYVKNN